MITVHRSRTSADVSQDRTPRDSCGSIRKVAVRRFAKLIALAVACAVMVAIYEVVGVAIQDGMIAGMITLLLYLPFVTLFARQC